MKARAFLFALLAAGGCHATATDAPKAPPIALPMKPSGALAPSLAHVSGKGGSKTIGDVETCETCHADIAAQWRSSAHAYASFDNPIYRVVVDRFREARGNRASHFCGGCHDVSLLVDDAMLASVEPTDKRAQAGVTCATCHGIQATRPDGNASYDLDTSPIPSPREGDPASVEAHRKRVGGAALRTVGLCASCHRAFLDEGSGNAVHLVGQDDATPWARSAFAGSGAARIDRTAAKECRTCHMPRVPGDDPAAKNGTFASHAFFGGHTWLAGMKSEAQLVQARAFLTDRVSIDVAGVRQGERRVLIGDGPIALTEGEPVVLDVVVRNLDVGHRFPGGVGDAQDAWIEITVDDARGRRIAEAGTDHETTGADPTAHTLSSYMAKADGSRLLERETQEFRANVWNHTIEPRDASVVGYRFAAPHDGYPLTVHARLRHRSRNLILQRAACDDAKTERGRAFTSRKGTLDVCRPQPLTDLATATVRLGDGVGRTSETQSEAFARRYAYGLGLSHALQEQLDDARAPLERAIALATTPLERAEAMGVLAQVAARQGRTDETFTWAERADREAGSPTVAMQRARGEVLAANWQLADAAPRFLDAAQRSPRDDLAWARTAVTFGGLGDAPRALDAAVHGLAIQPRDCDLLRVQSIALGALHVAADVAGPAEAAYLERRSPDDAPQIRGRCSKNVMGCANERIPVHVHDMR